MTAPELIIGIGSPFGDDRAGWAVIEGLQAASPPATLKLLSLDRPGPELIELMQSQGRVTLIDALLTEDYPPGQCMALTPAQLAQANSTSSHGFGLAQTLSLARALNQLPEDLQLLTITIKQTSVDTAMSPEVASAAEALARQLLKAHQTAMGSGGVGSLGSSSLSPS